MHAQRCPVAKMRAAAAEQGTNTAQKHNSSRGFFDFKPFQSVQRKQRVSARPAEAPSFFQKLNGQVAPRLPPHPQMYSDETPSYFPHEKVMFSEDQQLVSSAGEVLIYNENCAIHGRRSSSSFGLPKSASSTSWTLNDSRRTLDVERLKNWHRNSLTLSPEIDRKRYSDQASTIASNLLGCDSHSGTLSSGSTDLPSPSDSTTTDDFQTRRSQFRRAWTFFLPCDDLLKEKPPPKCILRQPTKHVYRRGISGLPVECTTRYRGLAF